MAIPQLGRFYTKGRWGKRPQHFIRTSPLLQKFIDIYTKNKRKEDYFNSRFENVSVLILDPMHMQCGLMSETSARLRPVTLKMETWDPYKRGVLLTLPDALRRNTH